MVRPAFTALLWAALFAGGSALAAEPPSLLEFELKSLGAPERHDLQRFHGQQMVMMFFQPECNWCYRQVQALNDLQSSCSTTRFVAVGVNGDRQRLRKEVRRLRPEFPAYQASPELLHSLGGLPATPFMLLGDADGQFVDWMRGYIPAERLSSRLGC